MTSPDWTDLKRRHDNWNRAGGVEWPIVAWEEFEAVARDMVAAEAEFHRAMNGANGILDRLVPPAERYCAWESYAPEPVVKISGLFRDAPNSLHPSDFRFNLTYGKSKRAPLEYMRKLTEKYRAYTRKVERVIKTNLPLAEAAVL